MASQLPAFRGSFGSTDFFLVTMKAGELTRNLTIPKEMDGWEDLTPEEKFQREVDYKRVATHIAPYLATDDDRFIGAFIVAVHQHEEMEFESLVDAGAKFPRGMPNSLMNQFGVLYLSGNEILVPLDGQHRLAALKFAISGKNNEQKDIPFFEGNPKVAEDTCTVILIRNDPVKARKIFNKVNRYAKPTSKADNLITADDDYIAVITREDIIGPKIDTRLVNIKSNTISNNSYMFTTLATVYEINVAYEEFMTGKKVNISKLPLAVDMALARKNLSDFWDDFLDISAFSASLIDPSEKGDQKRIDIRKQSVICKPIIQRALAEAIILLLSDEMADGSKLSMKTVIKRIDEIDWSPENPIWKGILMNGDKVITGNSAMKFAARILAYLLGQNLEAHEIKKLQQQFSDGTGGGSIPSPFFS